MRIRKNQSLLGTGEKTSFVNALLKLKDPTISPSVFHAGNPNRSRYDDYVEIHLDAMNAMTATVPSWGHMAPAFFPWHRALMIHLEDDLRAIDSDGDGVPDFPDVTIPYWDWTTAQSPTASPWTADFLGGDGTGVSGTVGTGVFAGSTGDWPLRVKDATTDPNVLTRFLGQSTDDDNNLEVLPSPDDQTQVLNRTVYDRAPWNDMLRTTSAQFNAFRIWLEYNLHNLVHRWVGGAMGAASSPNDPVFWLHHCNCDRLWSVWQRQHAAATAYLPPTGGPAGHNEGDTMIYFDGGVAPWSETYTPTGMINHHATSVVVWYDTDPPEINLTTPSVSFSDIQVGMTTFRAAVFEVMSPVPVTLTVTGGPSGGFTVAPLTGSAVPVPALVADTPQIGRVWVQFTGTTAGSSANGMIEITASATLGDGTAWQQTFNVTLGANVVQAQTAAIVLVLDRSYSMTEDAGNGTVKIDTLRDAASTFVDLLRSTDAVGVVRYNHASDSLLDVALASDAVKTAAKLRIQDDLDPDGSTGIGAAMTLAQTLLSAPLAAAQDVRSMLVLTDGNENVTPYVDDVSSGISAGTFAIGFGTAANVSAGALGRITSNHEGYLVVTGLLTPDTDYRLEKYFAQILAGVTNAQVVLDPEGDLPFGATHRVPFMLSEADIGADVIVSCPLPSLLDFSLETPSGELITPVVAAAEPAVEHVVGSRVVYYRFTLPALPKIGSHAGKWHAVLKLRERAGDVKEMVSANPKLTHRLRKRTMPYNLLVHARSNLRFSASLVQKSLEPGAKLLLAASLHEYDVPVEGRATVEAHVTLPGGSNLIVPLAASAPGTFSASLEATLPGVYTARLIARGITLYGRPFRREHTATGVVFLGGDRPRDPGRTHDEDRERLCRLLLCLAKTGLSGTELARDLEKKGVNTKALLACLAHYCGSMPGHATHEHLDQEAEEAAVKSALQHVEVRKAVEQMRVIERARHFTGIATVERPAAPPPAQAAEPPRRAHGKLPMFPTLKQIIGDAGVPDASHDGGHDGGHDHHHHGEPGEGDPGKQDRK